MTAARTTKETFKDIASGVVVLWWRFFDWLAVVPVEDARHRLRAGADPDGRPPAAPRRSRSSSSSPRSSSRRWRAASTARTWPRARPSSAPRRSSSSARRLEAHLEALQAQIEPHFLFNTLASIDQLILTDPPRASRMQQSLIRYLRAAMPQMRRADGARPTLGQQVDLSRAFLEIMAVRMEDRLQTVMNVPEGLKSAVFPSMMLQTLVENAIRHGLEPKAEGGRLEIRAEIVDGQLSVQVCDTGMGFAPNSKGGVGLANIRERLKVMYKDRAELVITVPAEGGTCATIRFPTRSPPPPRSEPAEHPHERSPQAHRRHRRRRAPDARADRRAPEGGVAGARDRGRGGQRARGGGAGARARARRRLPRHPHAGDGRHRGGARRSPARRTSSS